MGYNPVEPEDAVIGSILLDNSVLDHLTLTVEDFHKTTSRQYFQTMQEMRQQGTPIDSLTLSRKFPGKESEIFNLTSAVPTSAAVDFYADQVTEDSTKRKIVELAQELLQQAGSSEPDALIGTIKKAVENLTVGSGDVVELTSIFDEVLEELAAPSKMIKTPYDKLNNLVGGYRSGAVYIVAARPGVGKTMFALQNAFDLAKQGGVMFFSMEMSKGELVKRLISAEAKVLAETISHGELNNKEWESVAKSRSSFNRDLIIDDRPNASINRVRSAYRKASRSKQINAIVIDYLGLMQDTKGGRNRYEKVTNISNDLKQLARELNIPIIALHQLNREVESRTDPRPTLADLRDSGAIEQDADVVMLLHRPTVADGKMGNELMLWVAKNRHGKQGGVKFFVNDRYVRISEQEI